MASRSSHHRSKGSKKNASSPKKTSHKGGNEQHRAHIKTSSANLPPEDRKHIWLYGNHPVTAALQSSDREIRLVVGTRVQIERYMPLIQERDLAYQIVTRDELDGHFPPHPLCLVCRPESRSYSAHGADEQRSLRFCHRHDEWQHRR